MAGSPEFARARDALGVSAGDRARVDALSAAASASLSSPSSSSDHHLSPSFFEVHPLLLHRPPQPHRTSRSLPSLPSSTCSIPAKRMDATTGCLAAGAVVALVDEVGSAAAISDAQNLKVSVDMSVAFPGLSQARPGDELSITARALGHKGAYPGTHVLLDNADTGDVVAEGRHSLFGNMKKPPPKPAAAPRSKM